jgi:hypothetical protein
MAQVYKQMADNTRRLSDTIGLIQTTSNIHGIASDQYLSFKQNRSSGSPAASAARLAVHSTMRTSFSSSDAGRFS